MFETAYHQEMILDIKKNFLKPIDLMLAEFRINWPIALRVYFASYICVGNSSGKSLWQNVVANVIDGKYLLFNRPFELFHDPAPHRNLTGTASSTTR